MASAFRRHIAAATVATFVVLAGGSAFASTFVLNPVRIFLSGAKHSQTLTLRNESDQPLGFQLSASEWHQRPDGTMALTPTDDVVFFPELLKLKPGESRNVRVGVTVAPAPAEKTYRLFVEELAAPQQSGMGSGPSIRFLTRISVPIFVEPASAEVSGRVSGISVTGGKLSFKVTNNGGRHFVVRKVIVNDDGASGFHREAGGWYVLAGEDRAYKFDLSKAECLKLRKVSVQVQTEDSSFSDSSEIAPTSCSSTGTGEAQMSASSR